jgi:hypothetical protein
MFNQLMDIITSDLVGSGFPEKVFKGMLKRSGVVNFWMEHQLIVWEYDGKIVQRHVYESPDGFVFGIKVDYTAYDRKGHVLAKYQD